jgi:hypothetical protein
MILWRAGLDHGREKGGAIGNLLGGQFEDERKVLDSLARVQRTELELGLRERVSAAREHRVRRL